MPDGLTTFSGNRVCAEIGWPGAPRRHCHGEVRGVVAAMNPSPDVWHDLRVVGGAEGIVASRGSAMDYLGGWIYDLWLLERLAGELGAPTLPAVEVDEDWEIPYGMGDWAPKPWGR